MSVANGNADPKTPPAEASHTIPHVIGINLGNAFASIAILSGKEKGLQPECIANEDGERQIASAVSFHGEQIYIGNEALHQLVKNPQNTITGFRNLLGKKLDEISNPPIGAPLRPSPENPSLPSYSLTVLAPSPAPLPLPKSAKTSAAPSAAVTPSATPLTADPTPVKITHTPKSITTLFIRSLIQSAADFLGFAPSGFVLTTPPHFTPAQKEELRAAAQDAGRNPETGEIQTKLLQLLDETSAAVGVTTSEAWSAVEETETEKLKQDRTQLVVDVGASTTSVHVIAIRSGLGHIVSSKTRTDLGGDSIDNLLVAHFTKEFNKKSGSTLPAPPKPSDYQNLDDKATLLAHRAHAKLLLALPHLKRTLAASNSGTLSVESLHEGIDFTASLTRLRFDMLAKPVYEAIADLVSETLKSKGTDAFLVDEIAYTGSTASLPGLDEHLIPTAGLKEDVVSPFAANTVVGGGIGDPSTLLARGSAVQAGVILSAGKDEALLGEEGIEAKVTSKALGVLFPSDDDQEQQGGTFVTLLPAETPLPARRTVTIRVPGETKKVAFEVWEATEGVRIEKVKPPKVVYSDDEGAGDDEEEEEEEEVKHHSVTRETLLGAAELSVEKASEMELKAVVRIDGSVEVLLKQASGREAKVEVAGH
ncbi:Hsp70 protein that interacts with Zuo1p [Marasmius crinis-equi]|uniref:Hsp70 protein that interacts with Zuo1p n=1 Tax=Marasmius crinis-equi TaxID=585013 RepID=A0ABR3F618_9AGAR